VPQKTRKRRRTRDPEAQYAQKPHRGAWFECLRRGPWELGAGGVGRSEAAADVKVVEKGAHDIITTIATTAGLEDDDVTAHVLRHTFRHAARPRPHRPR
jgi:hypothetical protein